MSTCNKSQTLKTISDTTQIIFQEAFRQAFERTPSFAGYQIALPEKSPYKGIVLTGVSIRPSNIFFEELFKGSDITTTMPGSQKLFAFNSPHETIRNFCLQQAADDPEGIIAFSAQGRSGYAISNGSFVNIADLSSLYGKETYKINHQEILNILDSQKIYTSALLPTPFYRGIKEAMILEGITILPGNDSLPYSLSELGGDNAIGHFLSKVRKDPLQFGFSSITEFENLIKLTLYQIGSMVVKSEDYHIFIDGQGKIISREPGQKDAIRLINLKTAIAEGNCHFKTCKKTQKTVHFLFKCE